MKCCARNGKSRTCTGECSRAATTANTMIISASISPNRVTQRFADLIRQYGLRKIRFHDLRHTFASILINQDVPLLNVSTFLGHSDLSTTANIYAHLDKSKKQESADVISSIFNKAKE